MRAPSTLDLMEAWDRAAPEAPAARAVALARLACTDHGADGADTLPLGERERLLLALRAAVFGPRLTGRVECGACGAPLELDVGIDEILASIGDSPAAELTVEVEGYRLALRLIDSRDMLAAAAAPDSQAAQVLLQRCVVGAERNGKAAPLSELPETVVAAAGEAIAAADPLADLSFELACVACGHGWRAPFDAAQFLWSELDAWAGRTLREVHTLAAAYGWSEREILSMSAARRARYRELVEA
jgi:hypothetical protein